MSKIEYAKFQFMILVLRALFMLLVDKFLSNKTDENTVWKLTGDIADHVHYIENLMEEK